MRITSLYYATERHEMTIAASIELPDVASRAEVAAYVRVSPATLARWAMDGKGPRFRKAGSRVLYRKDDVLAWLDRL